MLPAARRPGPLADIIGEHAAGCARHAAARTRIAPAAPAGRHCVDASGGVPKGPPSGQRTVRLD
jgi:hypothetical protein